MKVAVIGAGLAGSECAFVLANTYGIPVVLFEMKSAAPTPAQDRPDLFAELVCSNSLKSKSRLNPAGVLKDEMAALDSLIVATARAHEVPAGETLAVDREAFSGSITRRLRTHPLIEVRETIVTGISPLLSCGHSETDASDEFSFVVVATGPLTADALAEDLRRITGSDSLYFYDAIAPILDGDTVDMDIAFLANRQSRTVRFDRQRAMRAMATGPAPSADSGEPANLGAGGEEPGEDEEVGHYLNLPFNKEEYYAFVEAVKAGDKVPFHAFEEPRFFNGCQPIEVLAESGPRTLSFGPMKPRGLVNPRTRREPYACVQLRKEKLGDNAYNMVGFQTRLTWTAQRAIFRTIPGLAQAEFHRMGSMHRNTYLVSPRLLAADFTLKAHPKVMLAGQVMGVEGYLESAAMGLWIGHLLGHRMRLGIPLALPPANTSLGALARYTIHADPKTFTPMNIHWGLFDELSEDEMLGYATAPLSRRPDGTLRKIDKSLKRDWLSRRADALFGQWLHAHYKGRFVATLA